MINHINKSDLHEKAVYGHTSMKMEWKAPRTTWALEADSSAWIQRTEDQVLSLKGSGANDKDPSPIVDECNPTSTAIFLAILYSCILFNRRVEQYPLHR